MNNQYQLTTNKLLLPPSLTRNIPYWTLKINPSTAGTRQSDSIRPNWPNMGLSEQWHVNKMIQPQTNKPDSTSADNSYQNKGEWTINISWLLRNSFYCLTWHGTVQIWHIPKPEFIHTELRIIVRIQPKSDMNDYLPSAIASNERHGKDQSIASFWIPNRNTYTWFLFLPNISTYHL